MTIVDRQTVDVDAALAIAQDRTIPLEPGRCFLCGATSSRVVLREPPWEARGCRCGLVRTFPQPPEDQVDATEDLHPDDFYGFPAQFKARWMSRHCPRGRLLEIGCGNGHFLEAARRLGYDASGLEPHPLRARKARELYELPVREAFLASHGLTPHSFDVVYHCDMLSHFHDPVAALRSMTELLRPGGVLCFEVGILGGIDPRWYRAVGRVGLDRHIWLYSPAALERLFAEAGLQVVHKQRFGLVAQLSASVCARLAVRSWRAIARRRRPADHVPSVDAHQTKVDLHARSLHQRLQNFLRYRVGAFMPSVGPQTLLYVVRPE